jgi:hypothetical protein
MPQRSAFPATYPESVARIQLTLPDDLLRRLDAAAERAGETRDEFLCHSAEEATVENEAAFRKEIEEMMPAPRHGGGDWGWWMSEDRRHRDDKRFGGPDPRFGPDMRPPDER